MCPCQWWVGAHAQVLPQSLDQISTYSVAFRKAIVSALPTSARIALWREQIAYYESAPGMSAKQQAFLASAGDRVANLVALSDAGASTDELAGPLAAFGNEAIQMFGKESALLMFANIGVNTPEEVTPSLAETPGNCSCNDGSANWCGNVHFSQCLKGDPPCAMTAHGCGWLLLEECNGVCTPGIYP
jgi:hypothetical protein